MQNYHIGQEIVPRICAEAPLDKVVDLHMGKGFETIYSKSEPVNGFRHIASHCCNAVILDFSSFMLDCWGFWGLDVEEDIVSMSINSNNGQFERHFRI